jgi:hypothetical protein
MNRTQVISSQPRHVKILENGVDVSAKFGIDQVQYNADGSAWRTFTNGRRETGTWRFLNPEQSQMEVVIPPRPATRWLILELHGDVFRKANLANGMEFIYLPVNK